jgi:hypothetical protein
MCLHLPTLHQGFHFNIYIQWQGQNHPIRRLMTHACLQTRYFEQLTDVISSSLNLCRSRQIRTEISELDKARL